MNAVRLILVSAAVLAVLVSSAAVAELTPSKPSDLVTAYQDTGPACPGGGLPGARLIESRLLADGTTIPFAIPAGHVFVITGVEVLLISAPDTSSMVHVGIPCGDGCMVYMFNLGVNVTSFGRGTSTLQLTNGVAVKPGVTLCSTGAAREVNAFATLRGYFAKDK